ncbi:MAG: exodeoxyribonuclease V subunit gamma, partial [Endozoicomonas sp.]
MLEIPAIQQRFQLSSEGLNTLRQWTQESGIRWGLTPEHQNHFGLPELKTNSWSFGIRRMLLGYAMPQEAGVYEEILPMDSIQGINATLAGHLASFIDTAEALIAELEQVRSIDAWILFTHQLMDQFFLTQTDEDEAALKLVQDTLIHLKDQLQEAGYEDPLSRTVFISYLSERLSMERSSQRFLAGQVNFCTLMPMRSIPFKVVCLLGMNDGAYPRSIAPAGFDLIAKHSRRGDRSRRVDDRYLFLEAMLSAQETLYISYIGRRIQDNTERIPSVLVMELLNYCEQGFGLSKEKLVTEHSLQAFSPKNFLPDTSPSLFSYTSEWLPAANRNAEQPGIFLSEPLLSETGISLHEIELTELLRFYTNPCRYFFNRRLKVYFNQQDLSLDETETFALDGLGNYQLKNELLGSMISREPIETLTTRLTSTGNLPHSAFGQILLEEQMSIVSAMAKQIQTFNDNPGEDREINIQINHADFSDPNPPR